MIERRDDMKTYQTQYGILKGIGLYTLDDNGVLLDCTLNEQVSLNTPYGVLMPQYTNNHRRKQHYALSFYPNGTLRRMSLEHTTDISTPIGRIPAELITYYPGGSIKRIFPLNGQLSGYWEEEDEYTLTKELTFDLPAGKIQARVIAVSFYENGNIKDFTFWPVVKLKVATPLGTMSIRIGYSLYPDGTVKSIEPAYPTKIMTPIGAILAFDKNASGISGDVNSLNFTKAGSLQALATSGNIITVKTSDNQRITYTPSQEIDPDGEEIAFRPLILAFEGEQVIFNRTDRYHIPTNEFHIEPYHSTVILPCGNCSACKSQCTGI